MLLEEVQDRRLGADLVFLLSEAVAFIVEDDVFNGGILLPQRLLDLVRFRFDDPSIVCSLQHEAS